MPATGLRGNQHLLESWGRRPDVSTVIFAEQPGDRRGDLCLADGRRIGALTKGLRVRTEHRHPNILGTLLIHSVFLPVDRAAAPAVVGGNDERGLVPVRGHGLQRVPEVLHVAIELVRALQNQVVPPGVRPIVGLSVAYKEHLGSLGSREFKKWYLQERIIDILV